MTLSSNKTKSALLWSFADQAIQKGNQLIVSLVLARLLLPSDIGLIGLVTVFMALAQSLAESGFGQALIQKASIKHSDECSVFYFNIVVGVVATVVVWISAAWIAELFHTPSLESVTRALSLNIFINSLGLIQANLLTRNLDFRTQVKANVSASAISGAVGILLAFYGFGVWSLVAQTTISNALRVSLLWLLSPWRPSRVFSGEALSGMLGFGSRLLIAGIIDTIFRYVYNPVIGALFSSSQLGYYAMATRISQTPSEGITTIVSRVMFPVFARLHDDKKRLHEAIRKGLVSMMLFNLPICLGLLLVANNLVQVVLSEKWSPAVPYLQLSCVVALLLPLHHVNVNALLGLGRSDVFVRLEVMKKCLIIVVLSVSWRWGVNGLIVGQIVVSVLSLYLNSTHIRDLVGYGLMAQLRDLLPCVAMGTVMAVAVVLLRLLPFSSAGWELSGQVFVGVVSYTTLCIVSSNAEFREAVRMLQNTFQKLCA